MDTLQKKYELRITELLESHVQEIQETKTVTIQKLERVLLLEFEKLLKATSQEDEYRYDSGDLLISKLIDDLTSDSGSARSIQNITSKLNQVLKNYKEKTDAKLKYTKTKLQNEFLEGYRKLQHEYERMRNQLQNQVSSQSPSILDIGEENGISPEKSVKKTFPKQSSNFTKEFRLDEKDELKKNFNIKARPIQEDKKANVDLERIVSDLSMVKNSLSSAAKQLGFVMVEPHKLDTEEFQEQIHPNVKEPVYSISQQYRHLLNTLLRFSRDLIMHSNEDNYSENSLIKHKHGVSMNQSQINELKNKLKKSQNDLKSLQNIFKSHCESELQIVDFSAYDRSLMTEVTKHIIDQIKNMHSKIMDLQTIFLNCGDDMSLLNKQCYNAYMDQDDESECDSDYSDENSRPTVATPVHMISLQSPLSQNKTALSHPDIRKSYEIDSKGTNCMAQLPRPSFVGGSITTRSNLASPRGKTAGDLTNRGSTESSKLMYNVDTNSSSSKPPKCDREARGKCMQERYKINQPNKSIERRNSFSHMNLSGTRNNHSGLASTQSLKNLSHFISRKNLNEHGGNSTSRAQANMNSFLKKLMK